MTHDGQNPSTQICPLAEEVAKAQSSLAGVLHQIHGLLPIASQLVRVATENRELSDQSGIKSRSSLHLLSCSRRWLKGPVSKPRMQSGCSDR